MTRANFVDLWLWYLLQNAMIAMNALPVNHLGLKVTGIRCGTALSTAYTSSDKFDIRENQTINEILDDFQTNAVYDLNDLSVESKRILVQKLAENNDESDVQLRLKLLGFTPLTYFGFALSGFIIACNCCFGDGWASRYSLSILDYNKLWIYNVCSSMFAHQCIGCLVWMMLA